MKLPSLKSKNKFSKDSISVGLDIGTSAIKLVELKFIKDTVELVRFNFEPVQEDLISQLKRIASSSRAVNISVSGASTALRYIDFPRMNENELKQALKFEVQKYIPFPIAEVNLDSYILKEELSDNKMLVLLAAVKKEFISQRLKLIQEAGLKTNIVDLDSLALINAFNFSYSKEEDTNIKNKTIAILNMGASMSNVNILENGLPALSRDIYIAGNNITQKIQDTVGIDLKSAAGLNPDIDKERLNKVAIPMEAVLSDLAKELRESFDFYESQSASSVSKIFLSGGGSKFIGLKDMLANLLGIEVEYWDSLRQLSIADGTDAEKIKALSAQLAVAVGLALRK
ncbi:MAG: type IV pilus assembly protein PilM [Candidatus Omnitrophota bacterium]|nr:type IV pilus assembly protein PilM [Candidatus Omnitrophota bacterium]